MADNNHENHNHEHVHGEGCDCDHDHGQTVTLTLEDNTEVECTVLGTFDVDDKEYIALLPMGDDEVLIYSYKEVGDEVILDLIETDEEFEAVSEVFYSLTEEGDDEDSREEDKK